MLSRTFRPAMFGIGVALLVTPYAASEVKAQSAWQFHLEEATIGDVHRAIRAKQITAEQLVSLYFKRIEAYNGTCVKGDIDSVTGLMLGDLTPIENRYPGTIKGVGVTSGSSQETTWQRAFRALAHVKRGYCTGSP